MQPIQILAIGFGVIILLGGILLSTPLVTGDGKSVNFIDGLFIATSSTCVTGLSLFDIYSEYNFLGQLVMLLLIQIGGLGFIAVAMSFSKLVGNKLSLYQRTLMSESIGALKYGGLQKLMRQMVIGTLTIEAIGAVIIALRLILQNMPVGKAIWFGIFHSVSAFCNAGFDLMGYYKEGSSLITFNSDPVILITIMTLIVVGGIGFIVWNDVVENGRNFRKYALHSKIMISFTAALILIGALLFFLMENNNAFGNMNVMDKITNSFFASITARTAGFASVDYTEVSNGSQALTMILMLVGAGPGSTGGGLKITVVAVIFMGIQANILNYRDYSIFKRTVPESIRMSALSTAAAYIILMLTGLFLLIVLNPTIPIAALMFEAISAIGTVGLSLNLTPTFGAASKLILIILMYAGRVGSLSVAMAIVRKKLIPKISYPEEKITV